MVFVKFCQQAKKLLKLKKHLAYRWKHEYLAYVSKQVYQFNSMKAMEQQTNKSL